MAIIRVIIVVVAGNISARLPYRNEKEKPRAVWRGVCFSDSFDLPTLPDAGRLMRFVADDVVCGKPVTRRRVQNVAGERSQCQSGAR